ncbi:MAG: phage portal protein, partial [Ruthenibacterium sp.]
KSAYVLVNGQSLRDFEFLKLTRKTEDGVTGIGVVEENNTALAVAYNAFIYENFLVKTGGNKKGFLKSQKKLSEEAMDALKRAFKKMYRNNSENVVVLNEGLEFKESSNTSVEMQLNENKKTNAHEMCKLFNMPPSIIDGTAKEEENALFFKVCISPILVAMETALNKDLLLQSEKAPANAKGCCNYFAVDTKELLKSDIVKRYTAYKLAIESNIMQIDECRYLENLPKLGLTFIKLGLQDVLYDPATGEVYTPNTDKTTNLKSSKGFQNGGDKSED